MSIFVILLVTGFFLYFNFGPFRKMIEEERAKVELLKQEELTRENEPEYVGIQVGVMRPKPKGKHCPLHNWNWMEDKGHICTWCNKTPRQIQEEMGGGRE